MSLLLDTNVIFELMRKTPNQRVVSFVSGIAKSDLFGSVLSIGEIRFGIERLAAGSRRDRLKKIVEDELLAVKRAQLLPVSLEVAERWAKLKADAGRSLPVADSLIAATALHHGLTLATRNVKDFAGLGLVLVDPFA